MRGLLVLPCALAATATHAQEGVYVGIGAGQFDYEENFVSPIIGRVGGEVSGAKLMGGFEINDYVAFEIDFTETHHIRQSGAEDIPPFGNVGGFLSIDFTITSLRGVGQLPFEWGALLGGLGYFTANNGFTETLSPACCDAVVESGSFTDDGMTAMVGVEWRFGRFGTRYGVRLEYEWWDMSGADASAVGLALSYGF
jgi:hypothetical protein